MVNAWKVGEIDGRYNLLKQDIDRDGTKLLKITIHITEALLVPQSSTLKKSLKTYAVKLDSAREQLKSQGFDLQSSDNLINIVMEFLNNLNCYTRNNYKDSKCEMSLHKSDMKITIKLDATIKATINLGFVRLTDEQGLLILLELSHFLSETLWYWSRVCSLIESESNTKNLNNCLIELNRIAEAKESNQIYGRDLAKLFIIREKLLGRQAKLSGMISTRSSKSDELPGEFSEFDSDDMSWRTNSVTPTEILRSEDINELSSQTDKIPSKRVRKEGSIKMESQNLDSNYEEAAISESPKRKKKKFGKIVVSPTKK
ncbi:Hypothetical protein J6898_03583 [Nakaseomyces glabratus]